MYESTLFKFLVYTIGGSIITFLFGGWNQSLTVLASFVAVDYVTGIAAAYYEGKKYPDDKNKGLNSNRGYWGIFKKSLMFMVIALLYQVDKLLGLNGHLSLMVGATWFYLGNELLSVTENLSRLDVPLPSQIKTAITAMKSKSEDKTNQK